MKKISLQTKLQDCSVPQRFIDAIKRGSGNIRTIYDLVSLTRCEFLRIGYVGKRCLNIWREFLEEYGLHLGMTVKEILQYDPDGILQYDPESGKIQYKLIGSFNCNSESNVDREQKDKFDPKMLKHFDKVIVRCTKLGDWRCGSFSHIIKRDDFCICASCGYYKYCIPYNDETKHLVGTTDEAPEYYKYWED